MLREILRRVANPVFAELPLFLMLILLLDYWAIYQFILNPTNWVDTGINTLRFLLITAVFSSILTIAVYFTKSRILKVTFYSFAIFLIVIDIYHYVSFHDTLLNPVSIMLILETNKYETISFIDDYLLTEAGFITGFVALLLVIACVLAEKSRVWIKKRLDILPSYIIYFIGGFLLLVLVSGILSFRCYIELFGSNNIEEIDNWKKRYLQNADRLTNLIYCFCEIKATGEALKTAELNTFQLKNEKQDLKWPNDSTTVILVIGESYSKSHSNLYGYLHQTNPRLKKEQQKGNLFVYNDVLSPNMHTLEALRNIFSTNSVGNSEKWYDYPFFPAIFHQAGYQVLFWDNQDDSQAKHPFDFTLNAYLHSLVVSELSYDAQHPYVSLYDGELVDDFSKYWSDHHGGMHHLVMFHLQGQHLRAEDHYPQTAEFQKFTVDSIKRTETWMTDEKKQEIAHYDNCTLYNDSVIAQIISIFRDQSSVLVYLSDHGENVYDIGDCVGRLYDIPYFYEIPFMIWCSDKYKKQHGDIVNSIRESVDKPLMSDNLCHLLMRLGGVKSVYYHENRDVLSPQYQCPPRKYN